MNRLIFSFLLITLPTLIQPFNSKSLDVELNKISTRVSSSISSAIEKKLLTLNQEVTFLKKEKSWKELSLLLKNLQKTPEYFFIYKTQEFLNLLDSLEDFSLTQIQPELLKKISLLLQETTSLDRPCRSFLQKERARLMDNGDEAILFQTKQLTISNLKESLAEKLQKKLERIKLLPLYKEIQTKHLKYLSSKRIKKTTFLIDKIRTLEQEKSILISTDKQCLSIQNRRDLLFAQTKTPCQPKPFPSIDQSLVFIRLDLFIAPLEILIL